MEDEGENPDGKTFSQINGERKVVLCKPHQNSYKAQQQHVNYITKLLYSIFQECKKKEKKKKGYAFPLVPPCTMSATPYFITNVTFKPDPGSD